MDRLDCTNSWHWPGNDYILDTGLYDTEWPQTNNWSLLVVSTADLYNHHTTNESTVWQCITHTAKGHTGFILTYTAQLKDYIYMKIGLFPNQSTKLLKQQQFWRKISQNASHIKEEEEVHILKHTSHITSDCLNWVFSALTLHLREVVMVSFLEGKPKWTCSWH